MSLPLSGVARPARPHTSRRPRAVAFLALGLLAVGGSLLTGATTAGAQSSPSTVPCDGCGPGAPGDGTRPWSYTEFVCDPQRAFLVRFGVGRNVGEPVDFYAGTGPLTQAITPVALVAGGLQPSASGSTLLPEPPQGVVKVRVVGIGARTGRTLLDNTRELACTCGESVVTTTTAPAPTTTRPQAAPTSAPATSAPATSTVASSTPGGESVTSVARLPETGAPPLAAGLGVVLVAGGLVALVATARRRPGDEPG